MSTKAIFISDLHFGIKKSSNEFIRSMKTYFLNELLPYCKQNDVNDIYILGDFWDSREAINVKLSNIVYEILQEFNKNSINIVILVGNHDTTFKTSIDTHSLKFFNLFDNVEVIDKITERTIHGKNVVMYPWQVDETFQETVWKDKDLCLGHFSISGCKLNDVTIHEGGSRQNWFFNNFKQTFSGHFHTWSEYKHKDSIIAYCGSPYHLTRHDSNTDRGFILYDFADGSWERVWSKTTLKYLDINAGDILTPEQITGNIIDVNVKIDNDFDGDTLNIYIKSLEEYNPLSVKVVPVYDIIPEKSKTHEELVSTASEIKTIPDMVHYKLLNMQNIDDQFRSDIEEYMNKLLDECSTI